MRLRSAAAAAAAALLLCGCADEPAGQCPEDAGVLPTGLEVAEGAECAARPVSVPNREGLACGALPGDFGGARLHLVGHPDTRWTLSIDRTDGSPSAICAAALDERCACTQGRCTPNATERRLLLDLGTVGRAEMDVVVAAGTYVIELCTR